MQELKVKAENPIILVTLTSAAVYFLNGRTYRCLVRH